MLLLQLLWFRLTRMLLRSFFFFRRVLILFLCFLFSFLDGLTRIIFGSLLKILFLFFCLLWVLFWFIWISCSLLRFYFFLFFFHPLFWRWLIVFRRKFFPILLHSFFLMTSYWLIIPHIFFVFSMRTMIILNFFRMFFISYTGSLLQWLNKLYLCII